MRGIYAWCALGTIVVLAMGCGRLRRLGYGGFGRDSWQQPDRVAESLALSPGAFVADLGSGGGYFTWPLADAVGEPGRVYAVDVDPDMTSHLEEQGREKGYPLRPGGRVAVIEFNGQGWFQRLFPHFTAPEVIRAQLEAVGYQRVAAFDHLGRQSFQVFDRADD